MEITTTDFATTILVDQTSQQAFNVINDVRGWWTTVFEGSTKKVNDVFTVRFGETYITSKVIELVADKKIAWQVIDCHKHWLKDKKEWMDTQMSWEISTKADKTQITFTHIGLVPGIECYNGCEKAWNFYINESLFKLLTEGKGKPDLK